MKGWESERVCSEKGLERREKQYEVILEKQYL